MGRHGCRLLVLVSIIGAAAPAGADKRPVPMKVKGITAHQGNHAVVLVTRDGKTLLPIWIGRREAQAIQMRLSRRKAVRPQTHDLMESMLAILGARVVRVEVDALRDGVFIGKLNLRDLRGKRYRLDGRPSDLITLSIKAKVPIHVAPAVLRQAGIEAKKPTQKPAKKKPTTL